MRKSASFGSWPSSSSRTAPPTTYASSPSDRTCSSTGEGLDECDRLDLDERARRELGHLDRRPRRRRVADVLRVHLAHPGEVVEVLEEDGRLHEVVERRAGFFQDRAEVSEHLLGLRRDVAAAERLAAGPQRELARADEAPAHL